MAKVINHKFIFIQKIMKKFFLLLFVLLGILFITKDINFVKVKAITEIKYVKYEFNGSYNNQTDFSINDFNINFNYGVSSNTNNNGIIVNTSNELTVTAPAGKYINKIEFEGIGGIQGILQNFYCYDGIVSYAQIDFDMDIYEFAITSSNSIVEYPNNVIVPKVKFKTV